MAYLAYPISKTHPPFGDIYHHQVPVIVTTVAELEETLGRKRHEWGGEYRNDTDLITITLGQHLCGIWLEAEVLLDSLPHSADDMIAAFDLGASWLWDWAHDFTGEVSPDTAILEAPHQTR